MRFFRKQTFALVDAILLGDSGPVESTLRISGRRIAGVGCAPYRGDKVINLDGALVLPGLINAHDHLELNNFPRSKWRERYSNAAEWIADFQPRFTTDSSLVCAQSVALEDRLFHGGLKNLLSGVTTVCQHNPPRRVPRWGFPTRVVRNYRFSHSILIDGEAVRRVYRETSPDWPWIIHAAEGVDAAAAAEIAQLDSWGCLGRNSVIVHGIGLDEEQHRLLLERGCGLIWCPSSNHFLFGTTADVSLLSSAGRVALGTDSRLSGGRDMLAELKLALATSGLDPYRIIRMVTVDAASILRLPDAGRIRSGIPADLIVVPRGPGEPAESLFAADRSTLRLVLVDGCPMVGDEEMYPLFEATGTRAEIFRLDGRQKLISKSLAAKIKQCTIRESGLQV